MSRYDEIVGLLTSSFDAFHLEVMNESHMHSVPPNSETHFKVTLVSRDFLSKSKVARHQSVFAVLGKLMQEGLHALALHLYVPEEWQALNELSPESPNCMGGSKSK